MTCQPSEDEQATHVQELALLCYTDLFVFDSCTPLGSSLLMLTLLMLSIREHTDSGLDGQTPPSSCRTLGFIGLVG